MSYRSAILNSGPSLYWDLAANGATDLSGNGRDGTGQQGITIGGWADSPIPGESTATEFDGSNDYITCSYNPFTNATTRTYTGWAWGDGTGRDTLFASSAGSNIVFFENNWTGADANTARNVHFSPNWSTNDSDWALAWPGTAQWVHWALVFNESTNDSTLYINGSAVSTIANAGQYHAAAGNFQVGRSVSGFSTEYDGKMCHIAVFERGLDADEIAYLYETATVVRSFQVREKPPLRLSVSIETPGGKHFRWGQDERRSEEVYSGLSFSTIAPGGEEAMDATLPRKTQVDYSDLERLSTIRIHGAGGELVSTYRLEKAPRESGVERSISPQAVGWQAALEDDQTAREIYVDRDLSHWGDISNPRRITVMGSYDEVETGSVAPDVTTGIPALELKAAPTLLASVQCESTYDAGAGNTISSIYYDYTSTNTAAAMVGYVGVASDDVLTATEQTADLITGVDTSGTGTFSPTARYRYGFLVFRIDGAHGGGGDDHLMSQRRLTVWGNHGLTKRGTAPDDGLYASDVIANAVGRWAPVLDFSTGSAGTIQPSGFIIPQLEFRTPTTVAEIIKACNRFHLKDWFVWGKTFYYHDRGARGKTWRSRVGEAKLSETGPQVDKLYNGVLVAYNDVDGTQKTVGPTGSGADTESATLLDSDPENPVNRMGIRRWATLDMGIVSTAAGATEVGSRFLQESRAYDTSGSATLQGHVTDDRGVVYPAFRVKAGDYIVFTDASDPSPRRIVKTSYDHDARACSIDLDSPPEGMDALLERLGMDLVPLGL